MKERERIVVGGLVVLMLLLWLGFLVHRSPRFAGSLNGSLLGIAGSVLMLIPLAYVAVKRIKPLKVLVTKRVSMRTLLAWHIYAGIVGPILVVLHTGHKFESALGVALTTLTIIVVVSGFIGRYLMAQVGKEIREKKGLLADLERAYESERRSLAAQGHLGIEVARFMTLRQRVAAFFLVPESDIAATRPIVPRAIHLAGAIADVEHAVKSNEIFKKMFSLWLRTHIILSVGLYILLTLHVLSGLYFGLRWL